MQPCPSFLPSRGFSSFPFLLHLFSMWLLLLSCQWKHFFDWLKSFSSYFCSILPFLNLFSLLPSLCLSLLSSLFFWIFSCHLFYWFPPEVLTNCCCCCCCCCCCALRCQPFVGFLHQYFWVLFWGISCCSWWWCCALQCQPTHHECARRGSILDINKSIIQ